MNFVKIIHENGISEGIFEKKPTNFTSLLYDKSNRGKKSYLRLFKKFFGDRDYGY